MKGSDALEVCMFVIMTTYFVVKCEKLKVVMWEHQGTSLVKFLATKSSKMFELLLCQQANCLKAE